MWLRGQCRATRHLTDSLLKDLSWLKVVPVSGMFWIMKEVLAYPLCHGASSNQICYSWALLGPGSEKGRLRKPVKNSLFSYR
jgi:hypothetical protein